jgi:hypothetical protein
MARSNGATNPAGLGLELAALRKATTADEERTLPTEVGLQGVTRWICPALSATVPGPTLLDSRLQCNGPR